MSDFNDFSIQKRKSLTGLQTFFLKLGAVVVAIEFVLVFSVSFIEVSIQKTFGQQTFWVTVESGLYRLADEKDLPEPKKAQIIAALHRVSAKYGPYLRALVPAEQHLTP